MQHRTMTRWLIALLIACLTTVSVSAQEADIGLAEASDGRTWFDQAENIELITEGKGWLRLRFWDSPPDAGDRPLQPSYHDLILVGLEGVPHVPLSEREKRSILEELQPTEPAGPNGFEAADQDRSAWPFDWVLIDEAASRAYDAGKPIDSVFKTMRASWEDTFTFNRSANELWPYNNGAFSGNLAAGLQITGSVYAKVVYKPTISGLIKPQEVQLRGNVTIDGAVDLTGSVSASRQFSTEHRLFEVPVYNYSLVGVSLFRLVLDSHVGFDASARVAGELGVRTDVDLSGDFDYHCVNRQCTYTSNFTDNLDTDVSVGAELEAEAEGWARARVWGQVVSNKLLRAEVGAKGFVGADLWGYYGNTCGDADGDGTNEWVQALAAGADAGYEISASVRGIFGNRTWPLTRREYSLGWWDLLGSGGSSALSPVIAGPATVTAGQAVSYDVKMRPCYPYDDAVTIAVTPSMTGSLTIPNPKRGAGKTTLGHTFPSAGTQTVTVLADRDAFGRSLQVPIARDIQVSSAAQAPTIVSQPDSRSVSPGSTATFSVGVVGSAPFTYHWRRNGVALSDGGRFSGTGGPQLTVSNVDSTVTGGYSVLVGNAAGQVSSTTALLTLATGGGGGGGGGGGTCSVQSFQVYNFPSGLPRVQWDTDCSDTGPISVQVLTSTASSVPAGCELDDALWSASSDGNRTADYMAGGYFSGCPAVTEADFHVELIDTANGNAMIGSTTSKRATFNPPTLPCDITGFEVTNRGAGELPLITWSTTCPDPGPVSVQVKTTTISSTPAGCEVDRALWSGDKNGSHEPAFMAGGYGNNCPAVSEAWFWVELWQGDDLIRRTDYELARYEP